MLVLATTSSLEVTRPTSHAVILKRGPAPQQQEVQLGVRFDYWTGELSELGPPLWNQSLTRLAHLGVRWVLIPVNWRFHVVDEENASSPVDLTGETSANRELDMLLRIIRQNGMKAILYVGPDLSYLVGEESLPAYIVHNVSAAAWNASGYPIGGETRYLPSIADPWYRKEVRKYLLSLLDAVAEDEEVIKGFVFEVGIPYRGAFNPFNPWGADYSPSALSLWRNWLQNTYGTLEWYNMLHGTHVRSFDAIQPPRNWSDLSDGWEGLLSFLDWVEGVETLWRDWVEELEDVVRSRYCNVSIYVSVCELPLPVVPEGVCPFYIFNPSAHGPLSRSAIAGLEASVAAGRVVANIPLTSIEEGVERLIASVVAGARLLFTTFPHTDEEWQVLRMLQAITYHLPPSKSKCIGVLVPHAYLLAKIFEGMKRLTLDIPPSFDAFVEFAWDVRWEALHAGISRARWIADWGVLDNSQISTILVIAHRWMPRGVQSWLRDYTISGATLAFIGHLPAQTFRNESCTLIRDLAHVSIEECLFRSSTPVRIETNLTIRFTSVGYVDIVYGEGVSFARLLSEETVGIDIRLESGRLVVLTAFPANEGQVFWKWFSEFLGCTVEEAQLENPVDTYGEWSTKMAVVVSLGSNPVTVEVGGKDGKYRIAARAGLLQVVNEVVFCLVIDGEICTGEGVTISSDYAVALLASHVYWIQGAYELEGCRFYKVAEYEGVTLYTLHEYCVPPVLNPTSLIQVSKAEPVRNGWRICMEVYEVSTAYIIERGTVLEYSFEPGAYDLLFLVA